MTYCYSPHQKSSFFVVGGYKHRDPQLSNVQSVRDFGALNPKWDVFINHPPGVWDLCRRGGKKTVTDVVDDTKETASARHSRTEAHRNLQRV